MFELHQKLKNMKSSHKDIYVCVFVVIPDLVVDLILFRTHLKKGKRCWRRKQGRIN